MVCHEEFYEERVTCRNLCLRKITLVKWGGGIRAGEDKARTHSWKVVLEDFFHLPCIFKYLLRTRDTMKNKLFPPFRVLADIWSMPKVP